MKIQSVVLGEVANGYTDKQEIGYLC